MTCPSELSLSVYADGESAVEEARFIAEHLGGCAKCRALAKGLHLETLTVRVACLTTTLPSRAWSSWFWVFVACAAFSPWAWQTALEFAPSLPLPLRWLASWGTASAVLSVSRLADTWASSGLVLGLFGFFGTCGGAVLLLALFSARHSGLGRRAAAFAFPLVCTVCLPWDAHAAEVRGAEGATIEVGVSESVHDSMFLSGKKVFIRGVVDGDVFVAAEHVEVPGKVTGNLFCLAKTTEVSGEVEGSVFALGQDVELSGTVEEGIYAAGENVFLSEVSRVLRSAYLAGESVRTRGTIGQEIVFAGARVTLMGAVERSALGWAGQFSIEDQARIGADLRVTVPDNDAAVIEQGARILGKTAIEVREYEEEEGQFGGTVGLVLAHTLALLLFGFVCQTFFPSLTPRAPTTSLGLLKAMGVGFVVFVATPLAVFFLALTVIGLPLAGLLLTGYGVLLFSASLVVAVFAVQHLPWLTNWPFALRTAVVLGGLLFLFQVPVVGAGLGFLSMLLGLGALVQHLRALYLERAGGEDLVA